MIGLVVFYVSWGLALAMCLTSFDHKKVLSLDEIRSKRNRYIVYAMIFGVAISLIEMYLKSVGEMPSGGCQGFGAFCLLEFFALRYDKRTLRIYMEKNPEGCFEVVEQKEGLLKGVYKVGGYVWPALMYTNKTIKEKMVPRVKLESFTPWHREFIVIDIGVAIRPELAPPDVNDYLIDLEKSFL